MMPPNFGNLSRSPRNKSNKEVFLNMPAVPAIVAVTSVISAVAAVGSGVYAHYQANQQAKAQEKLAEANAANAENAAYQHTRDAGYATLAQRKQAEAALSRQRALYAKAGIIGTTGTALLIQADSAATMETNLSNFQRQGLLEANALMNQANIDRFTGGINARATRAQGTGALIGGIGSGIGAIGSGIGGAASSYGTLKASGVIT
jgi:hypothetical protein